MPLLNGDAAGFQWEWEDECEDWNPYTKEQSAKIQNAFNEGESSVTLVIRSNRYSVDFDDLTQVNVYTDVSRDVRQVVLLPPEEMALRARASRLEAFMSVKKNVAAANRLWKRCVKAGDGDEMWYEAEIDCPLLRRG